MKAYKKIYDASIQNPAQFWKEQAEHISWFRFPENILTADKDGT